MERGKSWEIYGNITNFIPHVVFGISLKMGDTRLPVSYGTMMMKKKGFGGIL